MNGVQRTYANLCIRALLGPYRQFLQMTVGEALSKTTYGKADTKGFDASLESGIKKALADFNPEEIVLITEETDDVTSRVWPIDPNPTQQPKMFFSDPVDRSKYLAQILLMLAKLEEPEDEEKRNSLKIADLLSRDDLVDLWDKEVDGPATITGATSAITYVNRGRVIFSVILNFITREIFVACDIDIRKMKVDKEFKLASANNPLQEIMNKGKKIIFPSCSKKSKNNDDESRFVTFLGKDMYKQIFEESQIIPSDYEKLIHHARPGGPSRVLYLSDLQPKESPIGFILANGEKIGEWMHWLPFVKFAKNSQGNPALRIFEVSLERAFFKKQVLVSTPPPYSIFHREEKGGSYIDVSVMKSHPKPSHFRAMLVVAPGDNERIAILMDRFEYYDVSECL